MKTRALLAGVALAVAIGTGAAAQTFTIDVGVTSFNLPEFGGLAFEIDAPNAIVPLGASAGNIAMRYGGGFEIPIGTEGWGFAASGFYSHSSGSAVTSYGGGYPPFAVGILPAGISPFPFAANAGVNNDEYPATASAGFYSTQPAGFIGIAITGESATFVSCADTTDLCPEAYSTSEFGGPLLAVSTVYTDTGIAVALAGLTFEEAATVTREASLTYWGGQAGASRTVDFSGGGRGTAFAGAVIRTLDRSLTTTLDIDFEHVYEIPEEATVTFAETVTSTEDLLARYYGAMFGLEASIEGAGPLSFTFGGGFAPMFLSVAYATQQSFEISLNGETPIGFATDPQTMTASRGAILAEAHGAIGLDIGERATVSLGGRFEYLSAVPTIERIDGGGGIVESGWSAVGVSVPSPSYAQNAIGFAPSFNYGASLTLTIGLGGR